MHVQYPEGTYILTIRLKNSTVLRRLMGEAGRKFMHVEYNKIRENIQSKRNLHNLNCRNANSSGIHSKQNICKEKGMRR